ncbi:MAG: MaoC family dehydratase [Pseudomonadota bacterium]
MSTLVNKPTAASALIGKTLGQSEWLLIDQKLISAFGDLTKDPDPYHQDPEWAEKNSPFGGTIAYGFLTASLLSHLQKNVFEAYLKRHPEMMRAFGMPVNYGFDKLRFIAPVKCDDRIRGVFTVSSLAERENGLLLNIHTQVEVENEERPALIADWLFLLIGAEQS